MMVKTSTKDVNDASVVKATTVPRTVQGDFGDKPGLCTSRISMYLSAGCISPRTLLHELMHFEKIYGGTEQTYWFIFELLWRDYAHFAFRY